MEFATDFLVNPFSYILGVVSFVGFFIIARNEVGQWFQKLFGKRRAVTAENNAVLPVSRDFSLPGKRASIILGLVLMGIVFSALVFIINEKAEQLEPKIDLINFLLIMFALTMLPGGLAGLAAGVWINAIRRSSQDNLLERLLTGMLVYLTLITIVQFSEIHPLLFLCGPTVTLLVYRFSPA